MEPNYARLLTRSLGAVVACVIAVIVCYAWIDRPVAFFVYNQQISSYPIFRWLTLPPPCMQTFSPAVLALLMIRRAAGPLTHCQKTIFVACLSLIVADEFRTSLGDLCGRYWPETWRDNNPSLIGTNTYGFHPFKGGDDIGSFPSGHAARIFGFVTVLWIAAPRGRLIYALVCPPMLISLVAMNYHSSATSSPAAHWAPSLARMP